MKRAIAIVGATIAMFAGVYLVAGKKAEKRPPDAVLEMTFPKGIRQVTGNPENGEVCQEVRLCSTAGCRDVYRKVHVGRDFRYASDAQKKAWLIEGAQEGVDAGGLACGGASDDPFFPAAYAQRQCVDCGGGCTSVSCPATLHAVGPCTMGGVDCVITLICCGVPCQCV